MYKLRERLWNNPFCSEPAPNSKLRRERILMLLQEAYVNHNSSFVFCVDGELNTKFLFVKVNFNILSCQLKLINNNKFIINRNLFMLSWYAENLSMESSKKIYFYRKDSVQNCTENSHA